MWYNPLLTWLLRSPLHGLVSNNTLLTTVIGCKSGSNITLPVNYVDMGEELLTVSFRRRTWWRNLRGGAQGRPIADDVLRSAKERVIVLTRLNQ
jgi:hypothetical protein